MTEASWRLYIHCYTVLKRGASPKKHLISHQVQATLTDGPSCQSLSKPTCHFSHSWLYLMGQKVLHNSNLLYYNRVHHLRTTLCPIRYNWLCLMGQLTKAVVGQDVISVTVDCTWGDTICILGDVNNSKSIVLSL